MKKNSILIILIFVYIHLEVIHIQFKEYKFSYNFFAPATRSVNKLFPSFLKMPEVSQTEDIWWYARDLVIYIKLTFGIAIAMLAYSIREPNFYISCMFLVVIVFALKEVRDYIFFKNIFEMYYDNLIATGFIAGLTYLYKYKNEPERASKY